MEKLLQSDCVSVLDYPSGRNRFEYYEIEVGEGESRIWIEIEERIDRPIAITGFGWATELYITVQSDRYIVLFYKQGSFVAIDTHNDAFFYKEFWTNEVEEFESYLVFFGYMQFVILQGDKFAEEDNIDHEFGIRRSGDANVSFDPSGFINVNDGIDGMVDTNIDVKKFFQKSMESMEFMKFRKRKLG